MKYFNISYHWFVGTLEDDYEIDDTKLDDFIEDYDECEDENKDKNKEPQTKKLRIYWSLYNNHKFIYLT